MFVIHNLSQVQQVWKQEHFKVNTKQKALEWRQDNISHKLGDRRISEALGIWKIKKDHHHQEKKNRRTME